MSLIALDAFQNLMFHGSFFKNLLDILLTVSKTAISLIKSSCDY